MHLFRQMSYLGFPLVRDFYKDTRNILILVKVRDFLLLKIMGRKWWRDVIKLLICFNDTGCGAGVDSKQAFIKKFIVPKLKK